MSQPRLIAWMGGLLFPLLLAAPGVAQDENDIEERIRERIREVQERVAEARQRALRLHEEAVQSKIRAQERQMELERRRLLLRSQLQDIPEERAETKKVATDILADLQAVHEGLKKRITVIFKDTELRDVVRFLSVVAGVKITATSAGKGKPDTSRDVVHLALDNDTVAEGLQQIAKQARLIISVQNGEVHLRRPSGQSVRKEATPEEIAKLIKDLDSDEWIVREKATRDLEKIGDPARDALEKARKSGSLEVRQRVRQILNAIKLGVSSTEDEKLAELKRRHVQIDTMHKIILKQQQAITVAKHNEKYAITKMRKLRMELEAAKKELEKPSGNKKPAEDPPRTEE